MYAKLTSVQMLATMAKEVRSQNQLFANDNRPKLNLLKNGSLFNNQKVLSRLIKINDPTSFIGMKDFDLQHKEELSNGKSYSHITVDRT